MFLYIVFFFFKQNTAYEMRISDWSSDVCSSDLPYGSTYPGLTPNLQALAGDTMVVDNYYNHTAATYRGLQGQMTSGFPRYGGSEGGKGWMEGNNADGYATRSYSSLSGVLDKAGRSEEHTSELQSLMRTSYAVFCLKKKKHPH